MLLGISIFLVLFSQSFADIDIVTPELKDVCYQIGSVEELCGFADYVNGGEPDVCGELTAGITVNEDVFVDGRLNEVADAPKLRLSSIRRSFRQIS